MWCFLCVRTAHADVETRLTAPSKRDFPVSVIAGSWAATHKETPFLLWISSPFSPRYDFYLIFSFWRYLQLYGTFETRGSKISGERIEVPGAQPVEEISDPPQAMLLLDPTKQCAGPFSIGWSVYFEDYFSVIISLFLLTFLQEKPTMPRVFQKPCCAT